MGDRPHAGHAVRPVRLKTTKIVSATQTLGRASHGIRIQSMPALMAISVEKRIGYGAVMDHVAIQLAFRVAKSAVQFKEWFAVLPNGYGRAELAKAREVAGGARAEAATDVPARAAARPR